MKVRSYVGMIVNTYVQPSLHVVMSATEWEAICDDANALKKRVARLEAELSSIKCPHT